MAITKNARTLQASASNAGAATATGSAVSLATALGGLATGKITNGATGPTAPCQWVVETSHDGTNWYEHSRFSAGVANNAVYSFNAPPVPPEAMWVRSVFTGNTAQAVTVESFLQELTTI